MASKSVVKDRSVDIPLNVLSDVVTYLETLYQQEGKVVIIGGRAVNLQCFNSSRPTHDVDVLVPRGLTKQDLMHRLPNKDNSPNEYFECNGEISAVSKSKMYYHSDATSTPVELDFYYPHYKSKNDFRTPSTSIGGTIPVPMEAIFKETETVKIGKMSFTVPKLEVLMVMKYNTWRERNRSGTYSRDMEDMKNMIRNHGNGAMDFTILMYGIGSFMEKYIPEKKIEVLNGMLLNIPFKDIEDLNPEVKRVAERLVNREFLLRTGS